MSILRLVILILLVPLAGAALRAVEVGERLVDLRGEWRFEIGDRSEWADPGFDDSRWGTIFAPANWEGEGFAGYDGYAWYRRTITVPALSDPTVVLDIGVIDDVDQVYVNGTRIGSSGTFPPFLQTAYNVHRRYLLPTELLRDDAPNVIAVRIYDSHLEGGIISGRLGLYRYQPEIPLVQDLSGLWRFHTGDELAWADPETRDSNWQRLVVPARWEVQGLEIDGHGWYRHHFRIAPEAANRQLALILGYVDDLDETWLNGVRIGGIGNLDPSFPDIDGTEYRTLRVYTIPNGLLRQGDDNVLAVRVYDGTLDGGIYQGPVGLIDRDMARRLEREERRPVSAFWEKLLEFLAQ